MMLVVTIIVFLLILTFLVVAHEFGHFITARLFGVRVDEFAIGFPPRALKFQGKKMLFTINWLPLGGFVKLKGEEGAGSHDPDSFAAKPIWQRLIVLAAGVAMNVIVAMLLFWIGFVVGLPSDLSAGVGNGTVRNKAVLITQVTDGSPAQKAGLQAGDTLLRIDDQSFDSRDNAIAYIQSHHDSTINVVVRRDAKEVTVTPTVGTITYTDTDASGKEETVQKPGIGVNIVDSGIVSYPFFEAFAMAIVATGNMIVEIIMFLFHAFSTLVFTNFSGPVGIAVQTGIAIRQGFSYVLFLMIQLSLSLAILNILPLPALDGGRALFAVIEKVRGKPMPANSENIAHLIGFGVLMLIVLLITIKDFHRLF